ncbi:MAG: TetR/AcrR family transcriptional regulator [Ilumatobacter sp.]
MTTRAAPAQRRRPGRPQGKQVVADRAQLLAAAARSINASGPTVTLDDIAAEAGVTKPILYRTVGDKAALVTALSELLIDGIDAAVKRATSTPTTPRQDFEAAVRGYLTAVDADRNIYLFVNAGDRSTEQLRRLVDRSAQQLLELFSPARAAAGLDQSAARTWAYAVIGAFQTVTTMWLGDEYCDRDIVARDLTDLLWPGVASVGELG